MKALVHDGHHLAFFNDNVSPERMADWVNEHIGGDIKDPHNMAIAAQLNESWSCSASVRGIGPTQSIVITGDEDFRELEIVWIEPVL